MSESKTQQAPDRWLTTKQVARLLGKSVGGLQNDRHYGRGLPYTRLGRSVLYDRLDIEAYLEAHKVTPAA